MRSTKKELGLRRAAVAVMDEYMDRINALDSEKLKAALIKVYGLVEDACNMDSEVTLVGNGINSCEAIVTLRGLIYEAGKQD